MEKKLTPLQELFKKVYRTTPEEWKEVGSRIMEHGHTIHKFFEKVKPENLFTFYKKDHFKVENNNLQYTTYDKKTGIKLKASFTNYSKNIIRWKFNLEAFEEFNEFVSQSEQGKVILQNEDKYQFGDCTVKINNETEEYRIDYRGKEIVGEKFTDINIRSYNESPPTGLFKKDGKFTHAFFTLPLAHDEGIFGLGERFTRLNKNGTEDYLFCVDGIGNIANRAYKNIPFFISTKGYGLFLNTAAPIKILTGHPAVTSISVCIEDPYIDAFFIFGNSPLEILSKFGNLTGPAVLPPKWSFGNWVSRCMYMNAGEVDEVISSLEEKKYPYDAIHIDPKWLKKRGELDYDACCDMEWNNIDFPPNIKDYIASIHKLGIKVCLWMNPYVAKTHEMFKEGKEKGYFPKNLKTKLPEPIKPEDEHEGHTCIDFTNPEAADWFGDKLKDLFEKGADTIKTDYSEGTPTEAIYYNGMPGKKAHNLYPFLYNKTAIKALKESGKDPFVFARSGHGIMHRMPSCWSGDTMSRWDNLAPVIRGGLSAGLSGILFWSHDIGGFGGDPSPELYTRWFQLGMFCAHPRTHGCSPREHYAFGKEAEDICYKFAKLRYELLPYIYSEAIHCVKNNEPLMRALVLDFMEDKNVINIDDQYLFGRNLLYAPVITPENKRQVYFPKGKWKNFFTGEIYEGGKWEEMECQLDTALLFVKEGSIIATTKAATRVEKIDFNTLNLKVFEKNGKAEYQYFIDMDTYHNVQVSNGKVYEDKTMKLSILNI